MVPQFATQCVCPDQRTDGTFAALQTGAKCDRKLTEKKAIFIEIYLITQVVSHAKKGTSFHAYIIIFLECIIQKIPYRPYRC